MATTIVQAAGAGAGKPELAVKVKLKSPVPVVMGIWCGTGSTLYCPMQSCPHLNRSRLQLSLYQSGEEIPFTQEGDYCHVTVPSVVTAQAVVFEGA